MSLHLSCFVIHLYIINRFHRIYDIVAFILERMSSSNSFMSTSYKSSWNIKHISSLITILAEDVMDENIRVLSF